MKQENSNLFSRLLLWQKFLILGIITFILVVLPFCFYLFSAQKNIAVSQNELNGIAPILAVQKITQLTQQHREAAIKVLKGDAASVAARDALSKQLSDEFLAVETRFDTSIYNPAINKTVKEASVHWQALRDKLKGAKLNVAQANKAYADLIEEYFGLTDKLADFFALSLDPQNDSYFMMRAALYAIPQLIESLEKTRALGSEMLGVAKTEPSQDSALPAFVAVAKTQAKEATNLLQKTFEANANVKAELTSAVQSALSQTDKALKLAEDEIVRKELLSYDKKAFYDINTAAINSLYELSPKALEQLEKMLEARESAQVSETMVISLVVLGLFALGMLVSYIVMRSVTRPVGHLMDVVQQLAEGDDSVRANITSFDEIGILAGQFDAMIEQRQLASAKVQTENDTLNDSVIDLLQAVARLAQRDLTVKVAVAEDITGPVADALNLLSEETAKVLNRVVHIAADVASVSKQIKLQSDNVINIATQEQREVEKSTAELNTASETMFNIAQLAQSCNEAAAKAIQNTDKAQETVLDSVQGITAIRNTIRETEKRIKRLGERSQEISTVVTIINGIAERTHILALNASMHAASAGEAGKGFAVVANEVQKLAENARGATSQISGLIHNIQVETADTITTMNNAINQVVQGTTLAQQAGNEMRETRNTTANLVQLVESIASSSKLLAETTQRLRERSVQIQKASEHTYKELQDQSLQTERLVSFSNNLVDSVGVFTLPKEEHG